MLWFTIISNLAYNNVQLNQEDQVYIDELYNDLQENSVGDEQQIVHAAKQTNNAQLPESENPGEKSQALFRDLGKQGFQGFFGNLWWITTPLPRPVTYLPRPTKPWWLRTKTPPRVPVTYPPRPTEETTNIFSNVINGRVFGSNGGNGMVLGSAGGGIHVERINGVLDMLSRWTATINEAIKIIKSGMRSLVRFQQSYMNQDNN